VKTPGMEIVKRRQVRAGIWLSVALLVFFAAYSWFLSYQEARARAYLAELRDRQPDVYLSELSRVAGFDRYLEEFRVLKGYDGFRPDVPSFLFGRWALFPEAKRVGDSYFADTCLNSIAFEDGFVKLAGQAEGLLSVDYRLDGGAVTLRLADFGEVAAHLVSYGVRLHHIELRLPGYEGLSYGYLCK